MGFGALFIGYMFLYDFQIGLRPSATESAYAMLDVFPDVIGWILIFFGLRKLSAKAEGFDALRRVTPVFIVLSLFTLAKETLLFSVFYSSAGVQNFAGEAVDFSVHLIELSFTVLLFSGTAKLCRKKGEDKLSASHSLMPRIAAVEGALFILARLARLLSLPEGMIPVMNVVSMLDYLFMVLLVWFGAISLLRALIRISDE